MDVLISDDAASAAAEAIAQRLAEAVHHRGRATIAVSGGSTAPPLFAAMLSCDDPAVPWEQMAVYQVDERVAPDGDDDRNAGQLEPLPALSHVMPVTDPDLEAAAERYGTAITDPLDVVHLGVGDDGHTASWPPAPHPDANIVDRDGRAMVIAEFNGRRRMTLGPAVVNAARHRIVLTTGSNKAEVVRRWLVDGDQSLPITRVATDDTIVVLDPAAAARLDD